MFFLNINQSFHHLW